MIIGVTEGAQDVSFEEMSRIQQALNDIVSQDPDVAAYGATVGAGIGGQTEQQRTDVHRAEAVGSARRRHRAELHRPHPPEAAEGDGRRAAPAGGAGHPCRRAADQDRVPIHPAGRRPGRTVPVGAEDPGQAAEPADAARRHHRPADGRHDRDAHHRPRPGGALRRPAAGDRRHAVRRVRPAPDHPVFHAGELLPPDPRGDARPARATSRR